MSEIPVNIQPYVDVLGATTTASFMLEFGGAPIHLTDRPHARSRVVKHLGMEQARALGRRFGAGYQKVPINRRWLAAQMYSDGIGIFEIARRLHISSVTVKKYLEGGKSQQLDLFAPPWEK